MIFRDSGTTAADRQAVRDAIVRLRATIAVLDEELREPVSPVQEDLIGLLRPDLDVSAVLRDFEHELVTIGEHAELLRGRSDEELTLSAEWARRQQMSASDNRPDLAVQAGIREAQHQQTAEEMTRELEEFEGLAREYSAVIVELRRRVVDDASKGQSSQALPTAPPIGLG